MDIWALLSMRADRFWKKTGKKITIQGSDVAGFDKSKVECFNCHKLGILLESAEHQGVRTEVEERATRMEQRKNTENLTTKISKLRDELFDSESDLCNYKRGLSQVEASSQKSCKNKKGVGFDEYRVVPPPPAQVYSSPMPDLSWTGLPEFADNTITDYTRPTPSVDVINDVSELDRNNLTVYEHGGTSRNTNGKAVKASAPLDRNLKHILMKGSTVQSAGKPLDNIDDKGFGDSGCSRHMTSNISYLSDYEPYDG
ncbi:hypothetical protein Tco_0016509 [Tanacetum coccineum]